MRIRSIRPEFWSSEDVAAMDWHTRLVYIGLWSYVDDNGVGRDNERLIVADLFPLDDDPRESVARVSRALSTLSRGSQIARYTVESKAYLHIAAWEAHQRIDKRAKDRYPLPTCGNAEIRETVATPSRDRRDTLGAGEGEKGRRGEGEKPSSSEVADATIRPEIDALLDLLDSRIAANGAKKPARTKRNVDAARHLLDRDGHTVEQVTAAIEWATRDDFWRAHILSMSKLREKYDQLRLAAQTKRPGRSDRQADILRAEMEAARVYDEQQRLEIGS